MQKQYLEAGKIVGTHGLKGELRVQGCCRSDSDLCRIKRLYFNSGDSQVAVNSARIHKNIVLMVLDGIDTVEKADALRGRMLWLDRDDIRLEKGEYFIQDLIGIRVEDADTGAVYGTLTDIFNTSANDVYEITAPGEKKYLLPAVPEMVIETDVRNELLKIRPIKGIFDNEN